MAKAARKPVVGQHQVVEDTVNSPDFRRSLATGLYNTQQGIYQLHRPYLMEGYVGQNFYYEGVTNVGATTGGYGFKKVYIDGQHRLLSVDTYECPITLTLHSGRGGEGIVTFNWEKGTVYRKSILENSINYYPLQPGLFDPINQRGQRKLRHLNLGIVHDVSPRSLRAWIFLGTRWLDNFTLECPVMALICNRRFEDDSIPDLANVDDTSDYGVSFSERATGT